MRRDNFKYGGSDNPATILREFEIHMRKKNKRLTKAYQTTIDDFEIELSHCELWKFKRQKELRDKIEYFEAKIVALL